MKKDFHNCLKENVFKGKADHLSRQSAGEEKRGRKLNDCAYWYPCTTAVFRFSVPILHVSLGKLNEKRGDNTILWTSLQAFARGWPEREANGYGERHSTEQVLLIHPSSFKVSPQIWGLNQALWSPYYIGICWVQCWALPKGGQERSGHKLYP